MKSLILLVTNLILINYCYGNPVDLTKYLPSDYSRNGDVDYTEYLQKGLDLNNEVELPNFPILINSNGLNLNSNQTIHFKDYSQLLMKENDLDRYSILNLKNIKNVTIYNPNLVGDRKYHQGKKGEWGMGISILSSENIEICNPRIRDCFGDGIYIGEIHHSEQKFYKISNTYSNNVIIEGGTLDSNRRNGISIINAKNVSITNITISNSSGTPPETGICLEPNGNSQYLDNIQILNAVLKNNTQYGIAYVPSRFYGNKSKTVNITVKNSQISGSDVGIYLGGKLAKNKNKIAAHSGNIVIDKVKFIDNKLSIRAGSNQKYNPKVSIKNSQHFKNKNIDTEMQKIILNELKKSGINYN